MEATSTVHEEDINASRPTGSIIQIKAISIDLKFHKEMCTHFQHNFSIRGYAAEMRARNPKACNPFPSDDALSETPQCSAPLSIDVENVPDSCNVAAVDAERDTVVAAVNTDIDVRDVEEIAVVGDIQVTGNDSVVHEGTDAGNVLVVSEFQKAESSGLSRILPQEKIISDNDEQRIADTTLISGDPIQKIDEVAVVEPVDSVAPLEGEDMNNAMYDSDWSEENVPSCNISRRKARKVRLLSDLLGVVSGSKKTKPVREVDSATSSKLLGPAAEATSQSEDQILRDDDGRDYYDPQTKGKMPQEEGSSYIQGTVAAKSDDPRTKGDAEPAVKGNEIPSGAGLQIGNKADRLKRKHERNSSSMKKKSKPSLVHDAFSPNKPSEELLKSANGPNGDTKKCSMSSNMSISKSFSYPSVAGESANSSQYYNSPRETDKNDLSQKALQIRNFATVNDRFSGIGHVTMDRYPHKNGSIGSSGNQDSVETGIFLKKKNKKRNLCFGRGGTPPPSEQALLKNKQVLDLNERATHNSSHVLAEGSFPMPKGRDFIRPCEKEKIYENQVPSNLVSEHRNHRDGKAVMQGPADDIPMEIVELMAKNQYERSLGNEGSHLITPRTFNTVRRFPEMQDTRYMEPPTTGYSGYVRSGMSIPTGNNRVEKGNSIDYSRIGRSHYTVGQVERRLSIFDGFPQQILSSGKQFPATTASIRTGQQRGEVAGPSMFSKTAVLSFGHGSVQNFSAPIPESSHKGKTISDIKPDELKKTQEAHSLFPKPGGFELTHKPRGALDPYANENIPALQLLSLMDERSPGITFNGGISRILDNGFSPGYHLNSNTDGRTGYPNGSMFFHHNQIRESSGLGIVTRNAEECSGQRPFTFSGSLSLESQMHEKSREKLQIFGSASDVLHSGQTSYRGKDKQKAVVYSDIVEAPKKHSTHDDSRRIIDMESESSQENIMPLRTLPLNGICSLNRNPADFSTPEAGNEFTIYGRDIKFRKRKHFKLGGNSSSIRIDGPKQQRISKAKAVKEKAQNNEG